MVGPLESELDTADAVRAAYPKRLIDLWILTGYKRYIKARAQKPVKGMRAIEERLKTLSPSELRRLKIQLKS